MPGETEPAAMDPEPSPSRWFLLERFVPAGATRSLRAELDRIDAMGESARPILSILIPDEETCLTIVEAASVEAIRDAGRRADVEVDRIVEVSLVVGALPIERRHGAPHVRHHDRAESG